MKKAEEHSTIEALHIIASTDDRGRAYDLVQCLLKRWRSGVEIEQLIELLESENSRQRSQGAYYLDELGEAVDQLKETVTKLADDPISYCRSAFVSYVRNAGAYDRNTVRLLAERLSDADLHVRVRVIQWAVRAPDDAFQEFSRLVAAGASCFELKFRNALSDEFWTEAILRRAKRALDIVRCIRSGDDVRTIRKEFPGEDSLVFDFLVFESTRSERLSGKTDWGGS